MALRHRWSCFQLTCTFLAVMRRFLLLPGCGSRPRREGREAAKRRGQKESERVYLLWWSTPGVAWAPGIPVTAGGPGYIRSQQGSGRWTDASPTTQYYNRETPADETEPRLRRFYILGQMRPSGSLRVVFWVRGCLDRGLGGTMSQQLYSLEMNER